MEYIKQFIITLVTTVIFISAVEIIAPDNSMKKYIKFIMGLILISVMLNPIIYIFTKGESDLIESITEYENMFYEGGDKENSNAELKKEKEDVFKKNLNDNCDALLKEEYKDKDFKSNIQCTIDYDEMTYTIDKVEIVVGNKGVKLVDKININLDSTQETSASSEENEGVKEYLAQVFKIPIEKIEIYEQEG